MLKLKLQYFGHLMQRVDSLEKTLMLGGIGGRKRRGRPRMSGWIASLTWWTWVWMNSGSWWWTGRPCVLLFMGSQTVKHDWATELNWRQMRTIGKWSFNFNPFPHDSRISWSSSLNKILSLFCRFILLVLFLLRTWTNTGGKIEKSVRSPPFPRNKFHQFSSLRT